MMFRQFKTKEDVGAALKAAYDRKNELIKRIRQGATGEELEKEGYKMLKFA